MPTYVFDNFHPHTMIVVFSYETTFLNSLAKFMLVYSCIGICFKNSYYYNNSHLLKTQIPIHGIKQYKIRFYDSQNQQGHSCIDCKAEQR